MENYVNYHCYLCDKKRISNDAQPSCLWQDIPYSVAHISWSKILHFSDSFDSGCPKDSFFNQFERKCAKFICKRGYRVQNGACVKRETSLVRPTETHKLNKCLISKDTLYVTNTVHFENYKSVIEDLSSIGVTQKSSSSTTTQLKIDLQSKDENFSDLLIKYLSSRAVKKTEIEEEVFVLSSAEDVVTQESSTKSPLIFPNDRLVF